MNSSPTPESIVAIIPTCRRPSILSDTLTSLFLQTLPPSIAIISIPIGSKDDVEECWISDPRIKVIESPKGLTRQFNNALDSLPDQAQWIVKFDDDVEIHPRYIELAISALQRDEHALGLTGNPLAHGCSSRSEAQRVIAEINPSELASGQAYPSNGTWKLYGCNIVFNRQAFEFARFDNRIPDQGFMDDWDISVALEKHGTLLCHTGCFIVHLQVSSGRAPGIKFGYSQVTIAKYLHTKQTMSWGQFIKFAAVTFPGSNLLHTIRGNKSVDYRGRLIGNLMAWLDIILLRSSPERITQRFG